MTSLLKAKRQDLDRHLSECADGKINHTAGVFIGFASIVLMFAAPSGIGAIGLLFGVYSTARWWNYHRMYQAGIRQSVELNRQLDAVRRANPPR